MVHILVSLISLISIDRATVEITYSVDSKSIVIEGISTVDFQKIENGIAFYFGDLTEVSDHPQIIGGLELKGHVLHFKPKYGLNPGSSYTVIVSHSLLMQSKRDFKSVITIPDRVIQSKAYVQNVYPSASELPMNQLKLYIEFSAPMRMGNAYKHIRLYKMPEEKLEDEAFLTMPEELWDPERKRLTIFFDPGRIKRGVQPNLQLGLPLVQGNRYKLVVDKDWLDANGAILVEGFEKEFEVVGVDRQSPDPQTWDITSPTPGTRETLTIDFKEPIDFGLLNSAIVLINEQEEVVSGEIAITDSEQKWNFIPHKNWKMEEYNLVINAWLEDLAGNNLKRKFDVDLNDPKDTPKNLTEVIIPIQISVQNN